MQRVSISPYWGRSLLLALISLGAGVCLLLLSGWFIAASALAGMTSAALTFNYVIPSAAIRMLTFTRIMSSYGEKYFGHDALLRHMNALRVSVFNGVMRSSSTQPKSVQMERIVSDTQHVSNRFLAVVNPIISAVCLLLGLLVFVALMLAAQLWLLVGIVVVVVALLGWRYRCATHTSIQATQAQQHYRDALSQQLNSASIWHLNPSKRWGERAYQQWIASKQRLRRVEYDSDWWMLVLSLVSVLIALWLLPDDLTGKPILVCLPLLLLAFPDWLGQVVRALIPEAQARQAQQNIAPYLQPLQPPVATSVKEQVIDRIDSLVMKAVQWRRPTQLGQPVSCTMASGDIVWLQASSGAGKSSLMMALSGLLPSDGDICINDHFHAVDQQALAAITPHHLVYSEQFPQILLDTLRQNLLVAKPDATDEELLHALTVAELPVLAKGGLDQWLGPQGRLLSGGEQKRLGIARAYLSGASLWLLDEPFAAQDAATAQRLAETLNQLSQDKILIVASHLLPDTLAVNKTISLD